MKKTKSGKTRCGLTACPKYILTGENFGFAAIVFPESHETANYPDANGPEYKNGSIVCDHHARCSIQPTYFPYANTISRANFLQSHSSKVQL